MCKPKCIKKGFFSLSMFLILYHGCMKVDFYLLSRTFSYVLFSKNKSIDDEAKKMWKMEDRENKQVFTFETFHFLNVQQ